MKKLSFISQKIIIIDFFKSFFSPSALFQFSLRDKYILFIWIPVYYVGVFLQIYDESFISIFILTSLFRNN